eukprot:TRINITY_DN91155_c0_g1_i1.p1 TRINITY_DN91155_c0_g1~~TRINITY_DN91155_c0_g1_i1.p1  ORF type:complete len:443 (+),score=100.34 TRINITY_DN91155_c0_g1_i1:81-1409(+)
MDLATMAFVKASSDVITAYSSRGSHGSHTHLTPAFVPAPARACMPQGMQEMPAGHVSASGAAPVPQAKQQHVPAALQPRAGAVLAATTAAASIVMATTRRSTDKRRARQSASRTVRALALAASPESTADDGDMASSLQLQAAELRKAAAELEQEQRAASRTRMQLMFNQFDLERRGTIDAEDLRRGWREVQGVTLSDDVAQRLLEAHDENGDGALDVGEFDMNAMQLTVERLKEEDLERELAAQEAEQQKQEKQNAERAWKEYYEKLPGPNQDTGFGARAASVLAYALPLLDAAPYGLGLVVMFPGIVDSFLPLWIAHNMLDAVPFSGIVLFLGMSAFAGKNELPALLRYNLQQAVYLDIVVSSVNILNSVIRFIDPATENEALACIRLYGSILCFVLVVGAIAYSAYSNFAGKAPRSLGWASESAARAIGLEKPEVVSSSD